jgi:DNA polymerase I-like protein with 3'-5' exonuclease and polymerase domains
LRHLVYDIETNGLLDREDLKIHCIVAVDADTEEMFEFGPDEIEAGLWLLSSAERIIGHNIAKFDIPVCERVKGWHYHGEIYDTYLASRLIYASNMYSRSIACQRSAGRDKAKREARLPSKYLKAHSLKAWGYRLNLHKGTHLEEQGGAQEEFTPELMDYCRRDVWINLRLYHHLRTKPAERRWGRCSEESILCESKVGYIIGQQERNGIRFNVDAAVELAARLQEKREVLKLKLRETFKPWYVAAPSQKGECVDLKEVAREGDARFSVPRRNMVEKPTKDRPWPVRRTVGVPFTKIKLMEFNPGSGPHIAARLTAVFGWKPVDFSDNGEPEVTKAVLAGLDYPVIPDLIEYLTVNKRLGAISEGKQAWLKHVTPEGLIFGKVHPTGTRTSRMAHHKPNLAQVPKCGKPYGEECRALFSPTRGTEGWLQVGADASGIELRMLAHRMAFYDNGAFGHVLLQGDPHSDWMKLTGIFIRDNQKTFTYALLYGSGDENLGMIILYDWRVAFERGITKRKAPSNRYAKALGKAARAKLLQGLPALDELLKACRAAHRRGWIRALDGRVLRCKTEHGSLNDLLQSDAAIVMKYALIIFDEKMRSNRSVYEYMLNVHDEWQFETEPTHADAVGLMACDAMRLAGEQLGIRVPLAGEYKIGANWKECH